MIDYKGKNHPQWKGGKYKQNGYVRVYSPTHPYCDCNLRVLEHRLVMEKHLGRYLLPTEVVHHINGIRTDNRIENLALFSKSYHAKLHSKENKKFTNLRKDIINKEVRALKEKGYTQKEIAKKLKCVQSTISDRLKCMKK